MLSLRSVSSGASGWGESEVEVRPIVVPAADARMCEAAAPAAEPPPPAGGQVTLQGGAELAQDIDADMWANLLAFIDVVGDMSEVKTEQAALGLRVQGVATEVTQVLSALDKRLEAWTTAFEAFIQRAVCPQAPAPGPSPASHWGQCRRAAHRSAMPQRAALCTSCF